MERRAVRHLVETVAGGAIGMVIGSIAALNLMIATLGDYGLAPATVFERNPLVGLLAALLTVGGAIGGAVFGNRLHPTH
jgi:hypothetical protein